MPQPRLLVVEDDPAITTQLVRGLKLAGYEASSVATGAGSPGPSSDTWIAIRPALETIRMMRPLLLRRCGMAA